MLKKSVIKELIALLGCFAFISSSAVEETIVRIGQVSAISGPISHLGKGIDNGAKLAIEELNAKGALINGKKVKFILVSEDDAGDPKQGTAIAQKLVDAKVNGVVGHMSSSTTIPASKIYSDAGIPQITPSATAISYSSKGYKTAFRLVAHDGQFGSALGRYAADSLQAKKVAVIDDRTAYGQGIADLFIKELKAKNPSVVVVPRQFTNDRAVDFSAILTTIKAAKPDVIFLGAMDSTAGLMLRQMKAQGINVKLMGGDGICTDNLVRLAGDALGEARVICAVTGGVTESNKKAFAEFETAYKKRFGVAMEIYSPFAYDSVMTLADAMQQAKSADPAVYLPFLQKIHRTGVTGNISFDSKGDNQEGLLSVYTYKSGKRVFVAVVQ